MTPPVLRITRAVFAIGLVIAIAAGALLAIDRVHRPPHPLDPGIASIDTTKRGRLFILHVDSWRLEGVMDSTLFPQVTRLRARAASIPLQTVFEGFTIPAVHAAFTGHAETELVNLVRNFQFAARPVESFFRDAQRLGKRTLIVAREPFVQFGTVYDERYPRGDLDQYLLDRQRPAIAFAGWEREGYDVVVLHYESLDWVAHEVGIDNDRYRRETLYADSLVVRVAAALGPSDYLLAYGDHGHTVRGEHKTGFDIPTFALFVGPDVTPGVTTARLATTNLRYLASHALGITLRPAPYDLQEIGRVISVPIDSAGRAEGRAPEAQWSRAPLDYAIAFGVLLCAIAVAWVVMASVPGEPLSRAGFAVVVAVALAEFLARGPLAALADLLRPGPMAGVVALYTIAVVAKLVVIHDGGRTPRVATVGATTLLALVEYQVIEQVALLGVIVVLAALASWRVRSAWGRRLAQIVLLQTLVYFTLRLPLYLFALADLYLAATFLFSRLARRTGDARHAAALDAWIGLGAYTVTCGWIAGSIEWGFLYRLAPAHLVELQVQWFLPFILAKIPLFLLLTLRVADRPPSRATVQAVMVFAALRFTAVWCMRLAGAPTVEIWPLAEQGGILAVFVAALVATSVWPAGAQMTSNRGVS
ncbi:MAG: hypothetical protein P3B98_04015 [Gemmatimonadota bacterium]|nr:hypothetical protein [Gemmatimonadota bacterium]